jgi:hypothetical protein
VKGSQLCDTLSLKAVDDAATRLVARKIIELTQRGVRRYPEAFDELSYTTKRARLCRIGNALMRIINK